MLCVSVVVFTDKHDEHTPSFDHPPFVYLSDPAANSGVCVRIDEPSQRHKRNVIRLIVDCSFTEHTSQIGGSAINLVSHRADTVVKHCSFTGCYARPYTATEAAVNIQFNYQELPTHYYSFSVYNCKFVNNTAYQSAHLQTALVHPVTIAQCTFDDARWPSGSDRFQYYPISFYLLGDFRFDNSTISNNEGYNVGGVQIFQLLPTGAVILTDVLFYDNVCFQCPDSQHVSDCWFVVSEDISSYEFFDCFSTSAQPNCGILDPPTMFPHFIGPSITSVVQTMQENRNGDGLEVVLSFEGVFTGTSRKYDVTLEDAEGNKLVAENTSFSKTAGAVAFPLNNTNVPCLLYSTEYTIIDVQKSSSQATSNTFEVGDEEEPDWTWWYHTPESRSDNMIGMSFTTPPVPKLTKIKAELNESNMNEAIVTLTVSPLAAGSFLLVVFDTSDVMTEISIGPFLFTSSSMSTSSCTVVIHPSGILSYGKTYTVKMLSRPTLTISHESPPFQVPSPLRAASTSLNLEDLDEVSLSLTAFGFPSSTQITLTIVEVDDNDLPTSPSFTLTGTPTISEDSTLILKTRVEPSKLQHATRYEITQCEVTGRKTVLDGHIFLRVPDRPTLTGVDFSFATKSNTTFHLILNGTDLPVDEKFLVSLDGFNEEIEVTFSTTKEGSSDELALGWSDTLQFDTSYRLLSVILEDSSFSIPSTGLTLKTASCPNPLILYTSESANSDPKFCGDVKRPCSSVDIAWRIVNAYSAQEISLVLINQALLSSQIIVESGQAVNVEKHLIPPTLVILSTASIGESTSQISVSGTVALKEVEIDVQVDSLSFVLFDVKDGKLMMDSVHISGIPSSSSLVDGIEGLCSWETGLIKLHDSTAKFENCRLSSIEMGELWMERSNLSLISTQILSNGERM
ncbi:hypothetical protein BLNAU_5523 [Blattamonas nauphoetae]|uniref:Uncharacterized protein n=1 Tax=Blattamonas nauphoetae TaxID=2049346 RepID=A0ABQ9Y715_9EUKA|nr:hypothetical protein BLNAU_5523 [Blattamonas nauphoetae]